MSGKVVSIADTEFSGGIVFSILVALIIIGVVIYLIYFHTGEGEVEEVPGCTDPDASNYNELANIDDGSCIEPSGSGSESGSESRRCRVQKETRKCSV